jgi:hypothetical protein
VCVSVSVSLSLCVSRDLPSAHDMYISLLPLNEGGLQFAKDSPEGVNPKWQVGAAYDRLVLVVQSVS